MNGSISTAKRQWQDLPLGEAFVPVYNHAIQRIKSGVIVELGSLLGKTTCYLVEAIRNGPRPEQRRISLNVVEDWGYNSGDDPKAGFFQNMRECGAEGYYSLWEEGIREAAGYFDDGEVDFLAVNYLLEDRERIELLDFWTPKIKAVGLVAFRGRSNRCSQGGYSLSMLGEKTKMPS